MTTEDRCISGLCSACDNPVKPWTIEEIQEAKNDLGMSSDEDFGVWCKDCQISFVGYVYDTEFIPLKFQQVEYKEAA